MNVEIFGDKDFTKSVNNLDGIWVLMAGQTVYTLEAENGNALPVWVSKEYAQKFSENIPGHNLSPVFVPLRNFISTAWLGSEKMKFSEVLASPIYGRDPLAYTVSELRAIFET